MAKKLITPDKVYKHPRTFVRDMKSNFYNFQDELKRLKSIGRVYNVGLLSTETADKTAVGLDPELGLTQSLQVHTMGPIAPKTGGSGHGHQNPAQMYILQGAGYDVHDGIRYDYEKGDLLIIHPGCVHGHYNPYDVPLNGIVMKSKPLYMFLNLIYQRQIEFTSRIDDVFKIPLSVEEAPIESKQIGKE